MAKKKQRFKAQEFSTAKVIWCNILLRTVKLDKCTQMVRTDTLRESDIPFNGNGPFLLPLLYLHTCLRSGNVFPFNKNEPVGRFVELGDVLRCSWWCKINLWQNSCIRQFLVLIFISFVIVKTFSSFYTIIYWLHVNLHSAMRSDCPCWGSRSVWWWLLRLTVKFCPFYGQRLIPFIVVTGKFF